MLITALCEHYDALAKEGKVVPEPYSRQAVHYLIALNPDGTIENILDWRLTEPVVLKNGKTKENKLPRTILLPKRTEKTGIDFNFIEHRPLYIFGLHYENDGFTAEDKTGKAKKSHALCKEMSLQWIESLDSPVINAFRAFLQGWDPEQETNNPVLVSLGKAYAGAYFAFCLSGRPDVLLHEDEQITAAWERYFAKERVTGDCLSQCAVTGEQKPVARIHDKIKGIAGGQPSGTVLVGFKTTAGCSYGNEQAYNSNISEEVMKKYTYALNTLLADKKHKQLLDDITVVFWAGGGERYNACNDLFARFLFGANDPPDQEQTEEMLYSLLVKAREGQVTAGSLKAFESIDENIDFTIVGLKPNAARVSLKFIYRRRFGAIIDAILQHQQDMQIGSSVKPVPLWRLKNELKSPKSDNDKIDASLMALLFRSILYGIPYPQYLLSNMVTRIKTDRTINAVRAGAVKACINRKARALHQKEEFQLALDKQNTDQAYLCGRLFAVLEHIQLSAATSKLNRTIRDAYFSSAASKPALVFPKLLTLSQNHLKKLSEKSAVFYNKLAEEIIGKLSGEFPGTLMLTDQGKFMIGYYHQDQAFYQKQTETTEEESSC